MSRVVRLLHCPPLLAIALVSLALAACRREATPPTAKPQQAPVTPTAAATPATPAAKLQDIIERDPRYMVGVSFPTIAKRYPGLASALEQYANAAKSELMQAVAGLGPEKPSAPYDLSLNFATLVDTPQLAAVAADGSLYTGGAHGMPLLARFVWLPGEDKPLTIGMLISEPGAWPEIAAYVREQLRTALSQRIDADNLPAADRAEILRNGSRMIDDGTAPDPDNFKQFEPVLAADGRIAALRFVFAPYQVGPYSDGIQTVEVPAQILLPTVTPLWRALFVAGGDGSRQARDAAG